MHSSAARATYAMSTADKSSYSAAGTLHPYYRINPTTTALDSAAGLNVAVGHGRVRIRVSIRIRVRV